MPAPDHLTSRAELAARWRADAQVFRRYGSTGRARMLERLAAELEQTATEEAAAVVDLTTAAQLTGFTRGHLRRLFRDGRLAPVRMEGDEPLFRVADLPRKLTGNGQGQAAVRALFGERRVSRTFPRD
jgi:hypothetical protein